jgi:hypothetical protein
MLAEDLILLPDVAGWALAMPIRMDLVIKFRGSKGKYSC